VYHGFSRTKMLTVNPNPTGCKHNKAANIAGKKQSQVCSLAMVKE